MYFDLNKLSNNLYFFYKILFSKKYLIKFFFISINIYKLYIFQIPISSNNLKVSDNLSECN